MRAVRATRRCGLIPFPRPPPVVPPFFFLLLHRFGVLYPRSPPSSRLDAELAATGRGLSRLHVLAQAGIIKGSELSVGLVHSLAGQLPGPVRCFFIALAAEERRQHFYHCLCLSLSLFPYSAPLDFIPDSGCSGHRLFPTGFCLPRASIPHASRQRVAGVVPCRRGLLPLLLLPGRPGTAEGCSRAWSELRPWWGRAIARARWPSKRVGQLDVVRKPSRCFALEEVFFAAWNLARAVCPPSPPLRNTAEIKHAFGHQGFKPLRA